MAIFKRSWRLSIEIDGKVKTYQELQNDDISLKIDFDITSKVSNYSEGNITIYNLSRDDMYFLSSCARISANGGVFKQNKIQLECGYNGELGLILSGNIFECSADFTSPDKKLNIKAQGNLTKNFTGDVAISLNGNVDLKDICQELTTKQKLILEYDKAIKPISQAGYSFLGTPKQMVNELRKSFKDLWFYFSEDGKTLKVQPKENATIKNPQKLSANTGLVGTPTPTQYGIKATSLLNNNFKAGSWVTLESSRISQYNRTYYIREVKHKGTNQGNEWYSILDLSLNVMKA